jgi:hypothetical protein
MIIQSFFPFDVSRDFSSHQVMMSKLNSILKLFMHLYLILVGGNHTKYDSFFYCDLLIDRKRPMSSDAEL